MKSLFRRKNKNKHNLTLDADRDSFSPPGTAPSPRFSPPSHRSSQILALLPPAVLQRIFSFVCPHAGDESYETCEGSARDDSCMLCDLRDLSHCARVSRTWRWSAVAVLYHSIRIDPVHYCRLEGLLAEKRKKTSRFDHNGVPEDPAQARLRLLRRTVRDDPTRLGKLVQFLKMPYMLRESSHIELAQTLAVLPNLRYVDLPEGMFSDEPSHATLRLEVQARCPGLRKMTYVRGSEHSFAALATGRVWPRLEVLELNGLNVDPITMRNVLGSLQSLRALKVSETEGLSDEVLGYTEGYPSLLPLEELVLKDTPRVTTAGLVGYLSWLETQQALKVLTLKDTGVHPASLHEILALAPCVRVLALQAKVTAPFPQAADIPPLASKSVETLRYEISGTAAAGAFANLEGGYHSYLATSILSGGFPKLRRLYVHDDTFPEQLQGLPPPNAAFAGGHFRPSSSSSPRSATHLSPNSLSPLAAPRRPVSNVPPTNRFSSNNPFAPRIVSPPPTNTLEIFTKSDQLGKWNFARVDAVPAGAQAPRPVSSYGLAADVAGHGWGGGEARRSVMVGNGAGTFLAVPGRDADPGGFGGDGDGVPELWRPLSSDDGERSPSRDLWR